MKKFINDLAAHPASFSFLRKILEINFIVEKRLIKKLLGDLTGRKVVDIGCGTGEFAGQFAGASYYGVDISPDYIAYARRKHPGHFETMDATKLEYSDNEFDSALIMAILHHLSDQEAHEILSEAQRVVKPGGRILIMEDAKIRSALNVVTRPMHALDKGDFIRTMPEYLRIIERVFPISKHAEFRSGACTYGYFVINT